MNIALISPSKNAYSETFIQAHKNFLAGNVCYYYGTLENKILEGEGSLNKSKKRNFYKFKRKLQNNTYTWYYQQFLIQSLKKNRIEVVMAEYGPTAQQHLSVVKSLKLPLIVHFHGYDSSRYDILKNYNYYKEVCEYASSIIVVSKKMYHDFLDWGCPKHKLVYNVYGPADEFLEIQPKFSKEQFIAVGRFVDKKAPYYTIMAFSKVINDFPLAQLLMAGSGKLLNSCENLVKYLGLENNVQFLGIIKPEEYRCYLEESLAFVQHSITAKNGDSEGTPVAILEASAAGLPVISTKHAGIADVIEDGKTGFLVDEHDVNGMAKKMLFLLKNSELAKSLGAKGKQNIREDFNLTRHIKVLDELIERAVKH